MDHGRTERVSAQLLDELVRSAAHVGRPLFGSPLAWIGSLPCAGPLTQPLLDHLCRETADLRDGDPLCCQVGMNLAVERTTSGGQAGRTNIGAECGMPCRDAAPIGQIGSHSEWTGATSVDSGDQSRVRVRVSRGAARRGAGWGVASSFLLSTHRRRDRAVRSQATNGCPRGRKPSGIRERGLPNWRFWALSSVPRRGGACGRASGRRRRASTRARPTAARACSRGAGCRTWALCCRPSPWSAWC